MKNAYRSLLALMLLGCGTPPPDECAQAAAHVRACGAGAVAPSESCDRDAARQLLGLDCAALTAATATDATPSDRVARSLDSIGCAAGIVRLCAVPACTAPAYPGPSATCRDYIGIAGCGGCQFYNCREAQHACGPSGYYVAYAEKYCVRFLQTLRPRMSPAGQRF